MKKKTRDLQEGCSPLGKLDRLENAPIEDAGFNNQVCPHFFKIVFSYRNVEKKNLYRSVRSNTSEYVQRIVLKQNNKNRFFLFLLGAINRYVWTCSFKHYKSIFFFSLRAKTKYVRPVIIITWLLLLTRLVFSYFVGALRDVAFKNLIGHLYYSNGIISSRLFNQKHNLTII